MMDSEFEVMELTQGTELCQAMEARGDFKFKGIFAMFETIREWSSRMTSNSILPSLEQLQRETSLPADRISEYLKELTGRGSSKMRLVYPIPAVDFLAGPNSSLLRMIVYCRPAKTDGTSAKRYVQAYGEKNFQSLTRWIDSRTVNRSEYEDSIRKRIMEGRLGESQAAAEIARFFYSELDTTPDLKKRTYTIFARPVIKKLIASKHLILLPEKENARASYRAILYNRKNDLEERFALLARLGPLSSAVSGSEPIPAEIKEAIAKMDEARYKELSAGDKQVVQELNLLIPILLRMNVEEKEKKKKLELQNVLSELARQQHVTEIDRIKNLTEDIRLSLIGTGAVLNTEYAVSGRVFTYLLHRESVVNAVKAARELFDRAGDDVEVQILSAMGIERFLDQDQLRAFRDLEQRVLYQRLSWFVRIWRFLFGNSRLKPAEIEKAKNEIQKKNAEEKLKVRTVEAKKAQKKLVSERLKESDIPAPATPARTIEVAENTEMDFEKDEKTLQERLKAEEMLKKVIVELDNAWDAKMLPNREFLLARFSDFTEEFLVLFLKKYARKEIFSFRIMNDKPEYVWPILITRRYIKKNGKAMLSRAMADADEQRKANMPNQEKFDISTSTEDFLNRVLPKI